MKTINHISFDLDDTLVGTRHHSLNRTIMHNYRDTNLKREINHLMETRLPSQLAPKWVQDKIWAQLSNGRFMLDAKPTLSLARDLGPFKQWLQAKLNEGKTLSITTHRGWYDNGEIYSKEWLERYDLLKYFSDIHCIKSKEHPNKLAYLLPIYGNSFKLFDDNPIHHDYHENIPLGIGEYVSICRTEHSFKHVEDLPGYTTIKQLMKDY